MTEKITVDEALLADLDAKAAAAEFSSNSRDREAFLAAAVATVEALLADVPAVREEEWAAVNLLINRASGVTAKRLQEKIERLQMDRRVGGYRVPYALRAQAPSVPVELSETAASKP